MLLVTAEAVVCVLEGVLESEPTKSTQEPESFHPLMQEMHILLLTIVIVVMAMHAKPDSFQVSVF